MPEGSLGEEIVEDLLCVVDPFLDFVDLFDGHSSSIGENVEGFDRLVVPSDGSRHFFTLV